MMTPIWTESRSLNDRVEKSYVSQFKLQLDSSCDCKQETNLHSAYGDGDLEDVFCKLTY